MNTSLYELEKNNKTINEEIQYPRIHSSYKNQQNYFANEMLYEARSKIQNLIKIVDHKNDQIKKCEKVLEKEKIKMTEYRETITKIYQYLNEKKEKLGMEVSKKPTVEGNKKASE